MEETLVKELEAKLTIQEPSADTESLKEQTDKPTKKVKKTLFWGVQLKADQAREHSLIKECLEKNPELIPLKSIHTTLLYVGRKENPDEAVYADKKFKKCSVKICGHGYSENAMALDVVEVKFIDDDTMVPSFAVKQHVTMALKKGVQAVDSVKTLLGEGTLVTYDEPLILQGTLFCY